MRTLAQDNHGRPEFAARDLDRWAASPLLYGSLALGAQAERRRRHVLDVVSRAIGSPHPMGRRFDATDTFCGNESRMLTLDGKEPCG